MTERMVVNRVKKLKALEAQQKEGGQQIEALKAEIKADMERQGLEEQKAGDFIVRFTTMVTGRFDSKAFRADHEAMYKRYVKPVESRRFSIA